MRASALDAYDVVNRYWSDLFSTWQDPQGNPVQWQAPRLLNGNGAYDSDRGDPYGCGGYRPDNAGFCPGFGTRTGEIGWDLHLLRNESGRFGDAATWMIVAHEIGHAAQWRFETYGEGLQLPSWAPHATSSRPTASPEPRSPRPNGTASSSSIRATSGKWPTRQRPGRLRWQSRDAGRAGALVRHGYASADVESCLFNQGTPPADLYL